MTKLVNLFCSMALIGSTCIAWVVTAGIANAQSFSCANAQLPSEMAICNNESLLLKDEQVAALLASRLVSATANGNMQNVSDEHGQWLKLRNDCRNDMTCLEKRYDERIVGLTARDL